MKKIVFALAAVLLAGGAFAATSVTTLQVSADVVPSCTASTTPVNFGAFTGAQVATNGTISVTCNIGLPYDVTLDAGLHYAGLWRNVENGGYLIKYRLNTPDNIQEWGDTAYAGTYPWGGMLSSTGNGVAQTVNVPALLPAYGGALVALPPPGTYTDVVNVTVHY